MKWSFNSIACILWLCSQAAVGQEVYLCVWRNPERTMTKIFPQATDYVTETVKIAKWQREEIENLLGSELLPGQRDVFQYYRLTAKDRGTLGYIIAASQKGQYGVVEFVFGLDNNYRILGIYIQRTRERERDFKERKFLNRFLGLGVEQAKGLKISPGMSAGARAVVTGLRKELIAFEFLVLSQGKRAGDYEYRIEDN